jgi:hypothetical protein
MTLSVAQTIWRWMVEWRVSSSGIWRHVVRRVAPACSLVCWTILRPWRWRRYVPPKRRVQLYGLHGVIYQKKILFKTTAVKTSNPTMVEWFFNRGKRIKKRSWPNLNHCIKGTEEIREFRAGHLRRLEPTCPVSYQPDGVRAHMADAVPVAMQKGNGFCKKRCLNWQSFLMTLCVEKVTQL